MEEENLSECPICLQPLLYPVKLPCNHRFCFLCIKGIRGPTQTNQTTKTCAMCRQPFSIELLEQNLEMNLDSKNKVFKWFYEGKTSGYWAFDERSNLELENAFHDKKDKIVISIAGFSYCIDFVRLIQYPINHPERVRKIKRCEELNTENGDFKIKGIAGLRVSERTTTTQPSSTSSSSSNTNDDNEASGTGLTDQELSQVFSESLQLK
ncbi:hypothetical protein PVAND_010980 [Polypedilum vanderplanki]|uniref:E3 ubiquitin-protein ligase n=1 Tax=Polypedilum vanderplanki TaxID=319348 RepID=A0A9J6CI62_POLVA|nr:hypothetical protein PVAND_010980 [Polypedilum vanderplanki]